MKMFYASLLASSSFLAVFGVPCLGDITLISVFIFTWFSASFLSVSKFLLLRTAVILDYMPTLFMSDLILTNYTCSNPIAK